MDVTEPGPGASAVEKAFEEIRPPKCGEHLAVKEGAVRVGNGKGVYGLGAQRQIEFGLRFVF